MRMHYLLKPKAVCVRGTWYVTGFGAGGFGSTLDQAYLRWLDHCGAHIRGAHNRMALVAKLERVQ